jgi:Tfp pilus assembly protein PilW
MPAVAKRQRGASVIELMVGVAVGLIAIMFVTQFFVGQLVSNTATLKATRLNQELRMIIDYTARDVRRASYWGNAIRGVWYQGTPGVTANPLQSITVGTPPGGTDPSVATTADTISYTYDVNANGVIDDNENFTIRRTVLGSGVGVVEVVQGINAQTITPISDPGSTTITGLTFSTTAAGQNAAAAPATVNVTCIVAGPSPVLTVREIIVTVSGGLVDDPAVIRTMQETIRIRADRIVGTCPAVT